jgi:hypothetical protein
MAELLLLLSEGSGKGRACSAGHSWEAQAPSSQASLVLSGRLRGRWEEGGRGSEAGAEEEEEEEATV